MIATGADHRHIITLERSGNAVGGVYIAEGVEGVVYEAECEDETGDVVTFARGMWGSSQSAAANVDDRYFAGSGVLRVQHDRLRKPTTVIVR